MTSSVASLNIDERLVHFHRLRLFYGAVYGMVAGAAFAIGLWGWDAFQLSAAHAFFPWLKLAVGIVACAAAGGLISWAVAHIERACVDAFLWVFVAIAFSWLAGAVPLVLTPIVTRVLNPSLGHFIGFEVGEELWLSFGVALILTTFFSVIAGVLQSTFVESAAVSSSWFQRITPFILCVTMMAVAGLLQDDLVNAKFRDAIVTTDRAIQFVWDNMGRETTREQRRLYRATSLNAVANDVTAERKLAVAAYQLEYEQVDVIVHFDNAWVTCVTSSGQPIYCKYAP